MSGVSTRVLINREVNASNQLNQLDQFLEPCDRMSSVPHGLCKPHHVSQMNSKYSPVFCLVGWWDENRPKCSRYLRQF